MSYPRRAVVTFWLQATPGFPGGAPQREDYTSDAAHDRARVAYAAEWRAAYRCTGCSSVECPQCGAQGARR